MATPPWQFCIGCFHQHSLKRICRFLFICQYCLDELSDLSLPPSVRLLSETSNEKIPTLIASRFRYEALARKLILRVKVQSDHRALKLLLQLAKEDASARQLASWADAVIVAPSSLWGRVRGRLDLAAELGQELADACQRPLIKAPWDLRWRWRKHARKKRAERQRQGRATRLCRHWSRARFEIQFQRTLASSTGRILIVDDVVTTGATLKDLMASIKSPGREVRLWTLASALASERLQS